MKKFLARLVYFALLILIIIVSCLFLPATPRQQSSLLFAKIDKDSLLQHVQSPRIIFVGGSNLSFGLNSQLIKDSLELNPINTAINAGIGIIYMMDHTLDYVEKGDIVILCPEYEQFFGEFAYGETELAHTINDMSKKDIFKLKSEQILHGLKYSPKMAFTKMNPFEYTYKSNSNDVYLRKSFNKYGDAVAHWALNRASTIESCKSFDVYNPIVINEILKFESSIKSKKATLIVTYPPFQHSSFENCKSQINEIKQKLKKTDLVIIGTPEEYEFADSLLFNSRYHLTKKGADLRTQYLIKDFKQFKLTGNASGLSYNN